MSITAGRLVCEVMLVRVDRVLEFVRGQGIDVDLVGDWKEFNTFNDVRYGFDLGDEVKVIAEFIQNALDARDEYYLRTGRYIDIVCDVIGGDAYIMNVGMSVGLLDFANGGSEKENDLDWCLPRGYFGTGMVKAVCWLVDNGVGVVIVSGKYCIIPFAKTVTSGGKSKTLVFFRYCEVKSSQDFTLVVIGGVDEKLLGEAKKMFLEYRENEIAIRWGKVVRFYLVKGDEVEGYRGYAEIIAPKWLLEESHWRWEDWRKGITSLSYGFERGYKVEPILGPFWYNMCDRKCMINESRTGYSNYAAVNGYICELWCECDNYDLIKLFVKLYGKSGGGSGPEKNLRDSKWEPKYPELWQKAWKEVWGDVGVTANKDIYMSWRNEFNMVDEWAYEWFRRCGIPDEHDILSVEDVVIEEYDMTCWDRDKLRVAIDIAAIAYGSVSRLHKINDVRYVLNKYIKVFSKMITINRAGMQIKRDKYGCVIGMDIRKIYLDGNRLFGENRSVGFITGVILHELGHVSGYGDGNMDFYNVEVIGEIVDNGIKGLYEKAKELFGDEVDDYWRCVL